MLRSAAGGDRIIPALRAYLYDPNFQSFVIPMQGWDQHGTDGWFHPSTHPLWPERMLYYYLTSPDLLIGEPFDPMGTLAVTAGHFWHIFIQTCLDGMGMRKKVEPRVCPKCGSPPNPEPHFCDPETGSRGHSDGILGADQGWDEELWEFKTMDPRKMTKIKTLDDFIERCPGYYAQSQEYLRLSGYAQERVLLMGLILPYDMQEIVVPFNPEFAGRIRDKYRRVRQAAADQREPNPCCAPRSTEARSCPAREVCPVGSL
jgi:hypothetical protein